ncbi:MAG: hypothetical protein KatS3mg107_1101 [Gemmataceae bacterium]|jgi:hypothetical protein|nr:MAG: hypothetical protein KatS3mg107_1101 [Gemmataceae bacterium]
MLHSAVSMPQKLVPSLSRKARWFKASALLLAASLGLTLAARGAQQAQPATRSVLIQSQSSAKDKPNLPVQITVTGKAEYLLDTGSLTPEEYKKKVEKAAESGRPLPTPAVDLTVKITNISDKPVELWTSGDPVRLVLKLEGAGALNLTPPLAFTREFRIPKAETLTPGKSITFRATELTSGFRGRSHFAYWTDSGTYKLTATLSTGIKPAPAGSPEGMDGFGIVQLQSEPLAITVKLKK